MISLATTSRLRTHLALLWIGSTLGVAAELLLLEHTESGWQLAPLAVLGAGLAALVWVLLAPRGRAVRTFQALMLVVLASALVGLWLHGTANLEFEREVSPELTGWSLFWKSLHGTSPPSLAPGAMAVIGWIGLLWAHRHPALHQEPRLENRTQGESRR